MTDYPSPSRVEEDKWCKMGALMADKTLCRTIKLEDGEGEKLKEKGRRLEKIAKKKKQSRSIRTLVVLASVVSFVQVF